MATYKYLDYEGLKTLAKNVNDKISSITTSPIDLDDIEWDVLTRPALGTFYIEGASTPYSFEVGMTWEDWCNSEYSEGSGLRISDSSAMIIIDGSVGQRTQYVKYENHTTTYSGDNIIDNHNYILATVPISGGGGN